MPNWTYNIIRASGSKESLDAFLAKTTKVNNTAMYDDERLSFDFESIIPMPDNIFRGNIGKEEKEHCKATTYLIGTIGLLRIGAPSGTLATPLLNERAIRLLA